MSLTTRVQVHLHATQTVAADLSSADSVLNLQSILNLANGTGANQANVIWSDTRSLGPSASEDIDLIGGGLVDPFGVAVAPSKLRVIMISSASSNLNDMTLFGDALGPAFLNTAATTVTLKPGGVFLLTDPSAAGIAIGAGATDIIQIANAAGVNTISYSIVVVGSA
jgi:hypothetical protein